MKFSHQCLALVLLIILMMGCDEFVPLSPAEMRAGIHECEHYGLTVVTNGHASVVATKIWCRVP